MALWKNRFTLTDLHLSESTPLERAIKASKGNMQRMDSQQRSDIKTAYAIQKIVDASNQNASDTQLDDITKSPSKEETKNAESRVNTSSKRSESYKQQYRLLNAAQRLFQTENHRINMCSCVRQSADKTVDVTVNREEQRASFSNLRKCGNVWACPVCSRRISEERREEVQRAINEWRRRGYLIAMMTTTVRHNINQSLIDVKSIFAKSWTMFTGGGAWVDFCEEYKYHGRIRTLETTLGKNGWHVHAHTILFLKLSPDWDVSGMEEELKRRWMHCTSKKGGHADYNNGLVITTHENDISDYVTKHGKLPEDIEEQLEESGKHWNEAHEVTKAVAKNSRDEEHGRTPFALLQDYAELGDNEAGARFVEYVKGMKRQKQLEWSNGLKEDLLGQDENKTDEEIAEEVEPEVVAELDHELWKHIKRQKVRGHVLAAALEGDEALHKVLQNVKDGVYFLPSVTDDMMMGEYRVMIGRGKGGWYFALWDWRDRTMRSPDYRSHIGLGSELEARFIASRKVNQLEKCYAEEKQKAQYAAQKQKYRPINAARGLTRQD